MTPNNPIITYGQALASALRAFQTLETQAGWFERLLIKLLRSTYQQRLRVLVAELSGEVGDKILRGSDPKHQEEPIIFTIEVHQDLSGRWVAEILEVPGALAFGQTPREAVDRVQAKWKEWQVVRA